MVLKVEIFLKTWSCLNFALSCFLRLVFITCLPTYQRSDRAEQVVFALAVANKHFHRLTREEVSSSGEAYNENGGHVLDARLQEWSSRNHGPLSLQRRHVRVAVWDSFGHWYVVLLLFFSGICSQRRLLCDEWSTSALAGIGSHLHYA